MPTSSSLSTPAPRKALFWSNWKIKGKKEIKPSTSSKTTSPQTPSLPNPPKEDSLTVNTPKHVLVATPSETSPKHTPHQPDWYSEVTFIDGKRVKGIDKPENGNLIRRHTRYAGDLYYYYNNGALFPLKKEKWDVLLHLFPDGVPHLRFKQGRLKNCSDLAALGAVSWHDPAKLIKMIEPLDQDRIIINFPGRLPIVVNLNTDIQPNGVIGCRGVKLLETALGRSKKLTLNISKDTIHILETGDTPISPISPIYALHALTGHFVDMVYSVDENIGLGEDNRDKVLAILKRVAKDPQNCIALVASTMEPKCGKIIQKNHAYVVQEVIMLKNSTFVVLVNPHDTGGTKLTFPLNGLLTNFNKIYLSAPPDDY